MIIRRFHVEQIARLVRKPEDVPEGDGTMMNHTVIVYISDEAKVPYSRCCMWPLVAIGTAGGRLSGAIIADGTDGRVELFDLTAALGEQQDLAVERPDRSRSLQERLTVWRVQSKRGCRRPIRTVSGTVPPERPDAPHVTFRSGV